MHQRFFICKHCGNIIGMINDAGVPMVCCKEKMNELNPNTAEAQHEKHIPVVSVDGNKIVVKVGSEEHPMTDAHHIQWVYVETKKGGQRKSLQPGDKPELIFLIEADEPLAVFAYCSLHGLWKTEL